MNERSNKKVYATYDSKAEAYLQPFFMRARGEAIRGWTTVCNDPKTQFFTNPEDFTLFELGEYDEFTGTLIPHPAKISLGCAIEFKKASESQMDLEDHIKKMPLANNLQAVNNK